MRKNVLQYTLISIIIALTDIITKLIVQGNMTLHESRPVIGNFFKLSYLLNSGGVFGSKIGSNLFYLVSAFIVVLMVIYFLYREFGKNRYTDLSLFIVLGGAIGNLFDRVRMGAVVDFLDFDFFKFNLLGYQFNRWPTFNIADVGYSGNDYSGYHCSVWVRQTKAGKIRSNRGFT